MTTFAEVRASIERDIRRHEDRIAEKSMDLRMTRDRLAQKVEGMKLALAHLPAEDAVSYNKDIKYVIQVRNDEWAEWRDFVLERSREVADAEYEIYTDIYKNLYEFRMIVRTLTVQSEDEEVEVTR